MILFFAPNNEEAITIIESVGRVNSPWRVIIFCLLIVILLIYCFISDYRNKVKKAKAYAKINLFLNILNKRKDGYHNLKSVFDFVDLYDEVTVSKSNHFKLICSDKNLENEDNIIYKAYVKLKELFPEIKGVKVKLKKNIPMQAGLGGGSSDCATFISLMMDLYNLPFNNKYIKELCSSLGADVLPCYYNQTLLAEGIGDEISLIKNKLDYYVVIIKPEFNCSTKEMYGELDKKKRIQKKSIDKLISALKNKDFDTFTKYLYNDFETVVNISDIKKDLENNKASNSLLCGSGSCVFGIFKTKEDAQLAYNNLSQKYKCYLCKNKTTN